MNWIEAKDIDWDDLAEKGNTVAVLINKTDFFGSKIREYVSGYICSWGEDDITLENHVQGYAEFKKSNVEKLIVLDQE